MKLLMLVGFISGLFSCIDNNIKENNNSEEINPNILNNVQFDEHQADTLLAMYVSDLSTDYLVDEVLMYTVVEIDSIKYFYAKVKVNDTSGVGLFIDEVVIKFYDPIIHTTPYLTTITNKGVKYTCDKGSVCSNCGFKSVSGQGNSLFCKCLDNSSNNSDCSLTIEENTDLWDVNKFDEGTSILGGIVGPQYTSTMSSWPF